MVKKAAKPLPDGSVGGIHSQDRLQGNLHSETAGYTPTKSAMRSIGPPGQ